MHRREFLVGCTSASVIGMAGCIGAEWRSSGTRTSPIDNGPEVGLELVTDNLTQPIAIETPVDGSLHYVADKSGVLRLLDDGDLQNEPLLDIRESMVDPVQYEQGLLGMALHPEFETNRKVYLRYSGRPDGRSPSVNHHFVLSEFRADETLRSIDPQTERRILEIDQPGPVHQAGAIVFGPDGYLYVAVGDGGGPADAAFGGYRDTGPGHAQDWYPLNRGGNGQDVTENLLGSILRIDVNVDPTGKPYAIPEDNPLVDKPGLDEHFAWGLRNPYRMSFDRGRLFVGDVGLHGYEEVNLVQRGNNYGWNVMEGPSCLNANTALHDGIKDDIPRQFRNSIDRGTRNLPMWVWSRFTELDSLPMCPRETPSKDPLIEPVIVYPHERDGKRVGSAVIGGYVYRNKTVSALSNKYVFGDLLASGTGRIFAAQPGGEPPWPIQTIQLAERENGQLNEAILSFDRDRKGELLVLATQFSEGSGHIYKITDGK